MTDKSESLTAMLLAAALGGGGLGGNIQEMMETQGVQKNVSKGMDQFNDHATDTANMAIAVASEIHFKLQDPVASAFKLRDYISKSVASAAKHNKMADKSADDPEKIVANLFEKYLTPYIWTYLNTNYPETLKAYSIDYREEADYASLGENKIDGLNGDIYHPRFILASFSFGIAEVICDANDVLVSTRATILNPLREYLNGEVPVEKIGYDPDCDCPECTDAREAEREAQKKEETSTTMDADPEHPETTDEEITEVDFEEQPTESKSN